MLYPSNTRHVRTQPVYQKSFQNSYCHNNEFDESYAYGGLAPLSSWSPDDMRNCIFQLEQMMHRPETSQSSYAQKRSVVCGRSRLSFASISQVADETLSGGWRHRLPLQAVRAGTLEALSVNRGKSMTPMSARVANRSRGSNRSKRSEDAQTPSLPDPGPVSASLPSSRPTSRAASKTAKRAASPESVARAASAEPQAQSSGIPRWRKGFQVPPRRTPYTLSPRGAPRHIIELDRSIDDAFMRPPPLSTVAVASPVKKAKKDENQTTAPAIKINQANAPSVITEFAPSTLDEVVEEGISKEEQERLDLEATRSAVFRRLQVDGEINKEVLTDALTMLGFPAPRPEWIKEVYEELTRFATLNVSEFQQFAAAYEAKQKAVFAEEFHEFDADGSGEMDVTELKTFMFSLGITPLPGVLHETLEEVDEDKTGKLNFDEFETVLKLLQMREGFTRQEISDFRRAFSKFDRDKSGEVDGKELSGILLWLGYPVRDEIILKVMNQVDADGSGDISWPEFLVCMRWLHEEEVTTVLKLLDEFDKDGSGTVDIDELMRLLLALGYNANSESVDDALKESKLLVEADAGLEFSQLWQLLQVFRRRGGFSASEDVELKSAFARYDADSSGELSTREVGKGLRMLGYAMPVNQQDELIKKVDVDGSGVLDFEEFRSLMRIYREDELKKVRDTFETTSSGRGFLSEDNREISRALRALGCVEPDGSIPQYKTEDGKMELQEFLDLVGRARQTSRDRMRSNAGFTSAEVKEYRKKFEFYDKDGGGDIEGSELRALLTDIFPPSNDVKKQQRLVDMLQEVDQDGSGSLDFNDFLRLMRHFKDDCDREDMEAMNEGFTDDEVYEFKVVFEAQVAAESAAGAEQQKPLTWSGGGGGKSWTNFILPRNVVMLMVNQICTLQRTQIETLNKVLDTAPAPSAQYASFSGFLRVMRVTVDYNYGNIKDRHVRTHSKEPAKQFNKEKSNLLNLEKRVEQELEHTVAMLESEGS